MNTLLAICSVYTLQIHVFGISWAAERERESSAENKWHLYLFSYLSASCCIQLKPSYFPMISEFVEFNTHIFFMLRESNVHMLWLASRYPIWESFVSPECVTLSSILISIHLEMFGSVNTIALKCDHIWTGMGFVFVLVSRNSIHFFLCYPSSLIWLLSIWTKSLFCFCSFSFISVLMRRQCGDGAIFLLNHFRIKAYLQMSFWCFVGV